MPPVGVHPDADDFHHRGRVEITLRFHPGVDGLVRHGRFVSDIRVLIASNKTPIHNVPQTPTEWNCVITIQDGRARDTDNSRERTRYSYLPLLTKLTQSPWFLNFRGIVKPRQPPFLH